MSKQELREAKSGETTNHELERFFIGKKTGLPFKQFGGIYSKDELSGVDLEDKFYIVNMENSGDGQGTHWVLVFNVRPRQILYFDSFGLPPPEEILRFMRRAKTKAKNADRDPKKKLFYSTFQIQDLEDSNCGYFVAYVAKQLLRGKAFLNILFDFDTGFKRWKNSLLIDRIKKSKFIQEYARNSW